MEELVDRAEEIMGAANARVVAVAADAEVGRIELVGVCPVRDLHLLLTDPSVAPDQLASLRAAGLPCEVVGAR